MSAGSTDSNDLGPLLDEFIARFRRGDAPSISDFARAHPHCAEEIRSVLPAMVALERVGADQGTADASSGNITPDGTVLTRVGEFRIIREIGRGGMGIVYEAEQESLGRRVALKVLPYYAVLDPKQLERFRREVRAVAQLHHTNIVPVFAVGDEDGIHFYAMQFIRGQALDEVISELRRLQSQPPEDRVRNSAIAVTADLLLSGDVFAVSRSQTGSAPQVVAAANTPETGTPATETNPDAVDQEACDPKAVGAAAADPARGQRNRTANPLSADQSSASTSSRGSLFRSAALLCHQVAEALDYAHNRGILHRDVKPSNILLDALGTAWVTDFGLARTDGDDLTHTGDLVGTLRYMAPERFRGWSDPRSDVYSLGLTLYELVTLQPAFRETDRARLIQQVSVSAPLPPRRLEPALPRNLETIILKAISRDAESRYQTAREMADDIRRYLDDKPITARRPGPTERALLWLRRNPLVATLSGFILLLMLVLTIVSSAAAFYLQQRNHEVASALVRVRTAEKEQRQANQLATRRLFDAYIAQARAGWNSTRPGRRFKSFDAIAQAAQLMDQLDLQKEFTLSLRNEAIATLSLQDLHPDIQLELPGTPAARERWALDSTLSTVAHVTDDSTLRITDIATGEDIHTFPMNWVIYDDPPYVRFSPDDRYIAAIGMDARKQGILLVVDRRGGQRLLQQDGIDISEFARALEFSPDSLTLAYRSGRELAVLALPGCVELARRELSYEADTFSFCPRGDHIAMPTGSGITVVDWQDPGAAPVVISAPAYLNDVDWSPSGRFIAGGGADGKIYLWETSELDRPDRILEGHNSQIRRLEFHPGGDVLASWAWDDTTRLWNPFLGQQLVQVDGYRNARFHRDGTQLGFEMAGRHVGRWQVTGVPSHRALSGRRHDVEVDDLTLHPDGTLLALMSDDGISIRRWPSGREILLIPPYSPHRGAASFQCEFSADGRFLYTSGISSVDRYSTESLRTGELDAVQDAWVRISRMKSEDYPATFALDSSGTRLAVLNGAADVALLTLDEQGNILRRDALPATWTDWFLTMSSDGRWTVATGKHSDRARIFDNQTQSLACEIQGLGNGTRALFSPDDSRLVVVTADGAEFFETGTWRRIGVVPPRSSRHGRACFSHDGTLFAMQDVTEVHLYDATTLAPVATFPVPGQEQIAVGFPEGAPGLSFSHDGRFLLTGTSVNTVHVWDLQQTRRQLAEIGLTWNSTEPVAVSEFDAPLSVGGRDLSAARDLWTPQQREETILESRMARRKHVEKRLAADPDDIEALKVRLSLNLSDNALQAAIGDATRLTELEPESGGHFRMRAQLNEQLHNTADSIRDWRRSLELDPSSDTAMNALAWSLVNGPEELRDVADGVTWARRAVAAAPDNANYRNTLGVALYRSGDFAEALRILQENAEQPANTSPAFDWFFAAMCSARQGDDESAQQFWDRAMDWWTQETDLHQDLHSELKRIAREAAGVMSR